MIDDLTCSDRLDQVEVANSQLLGGQPHFLVARILGNLSWGERGAIALEACDEVLLFLLLLFVNWFLGEVVAAVASKEFVAVGSVEVRLKFGGGHLDSLKAKSSWNDARRVFEIDDSLWRQHSC